MAGLLQILVRWGLRTLGDIARLARADVHARFGDVGVRLHQAACGEDAIPLWPEAEPRRFVERMALEWPVEGLEPLSFVVARVCDALCETLVRADRGAVHVTSRFTLVTRTCHVRELHLPSPMHDARVLRTLILLDLESHPPSAGVDAVEIDVDVAPGRIVQGSLLARAMPSPETLSTLVARLNALMGETRVGAPVLVDTHDDRIVQMAPFSPKADTLERQSIEAATKPAPLRQHLRHFRLPLAVRVIAERGRPTQVRSHGSGFAGGHVLVAAGPWRNSGAWWTRDRASWDRDEWDVALSDGAIYRLTRDRRNKIWEVDGIYD